MKTFFSVAVLGCAIAASGLSGCNKTSAAPDKMSGGKAGMEDKMMNDHMAGDKMGTDKMAGDKMAGDNAHGKMSADKMGTDKMSK